MRSATFSTPSAGGLRPKQRSLCRTNTRNRTGCVGIAYETRRYKSGLVRHFFDALTAGAGERGKHKQFCLETLGKQEAWRRALQARAAYVLRMGAAVPTTATPQGPAAGNPDKATPRRKG